jgi:hypothetical protein
MLKAGFTSIPNEMLEKLLYKDLTALQFRIIIALYRFVDGYADKRGSHLTLYKLHKIIGGNHKRLRENLYILKSMKYLDIVGDNKMGYKIYPLQSVYLTKSIPYEMNLTDCKLTNEQSVPHDHDIEPTPANDSENLKKSTNKSTNKSSTTTFEISDLEILMKSTIKNKYFNTTKENPQKVTDMLTFGKDICVEAIKIVEDLKSIPNNPFSYTHGVAKKLHEQKMIENELNESKEIKELKYHLEYIPTVIDEIGNEIKTIEDYEKHLHYIGLCQNVLDGGNNIPKSELREMNLKLLDIGKTFVEFKELMK